MSVADLVRVAVVLAGELPPGQVRAYIERVPQRRPTPHVCRDRGRTRVSERQARREVAAAVERARMHLETSDRPATIPRVTLIGPATLTDAQGLTPPKQGERRDARWDSTEV
jgi:hypothetical protein